MIDKMMSKTVFRMPALLLAASLAALMTLSCKSQYEMMLESNDVPAKYRMAFELFDAGKYSKAASMFESLKLGVRGTLQDDTVQYYTAYSHYCFGDMVAAEQAFDSYISMFPPQPVCGQGPFHVSGLPVPGHLQV